MKHLPGGRTSAVMIYPSCSHCFEAVFCEPLGKEGRALRAEVAGLIKEVRDAQAIAAEAVELCALKEAGMRGDHATSIAAMQIRLAHCEGLLQDALARIRDLERRLAEHNGGHNPDDMVLIAALRAEVAALSKLVRYYENLNSRQGMPSLLKGKAKKLGEEIARSCRRNGGTGVPIGPPVGRRGCSHRVKADRTAEFGPAGSCGRCGSVMVVPCGVVGKMYREFDEDGTNVLINTWLRKHYVECLNCWEVTGPPGAPDIEGTCFGAVALARFVGLYLARVVDREAEVLLEDLYGFKTAPTPCGTAERPPRAGSSPLWRCSRISCAHPATSTPTRRATPAPTAAARGTRGPRPARGPP